MKHQDFNSFIYHQINRLPGLLMSKFNKGRQEHGQDPHDIDVDEEIMNESLDMMLYVLIKQYQVKYMNSARREVSTTSNMNHMSQISLSVYEPLYTVLYQYHTPQGKTFRELVDQTEADMHNNELRGVRIIRAKAQ